jgi:hypothetical protein
MVIGKKVFDDPIIDVNGRLPDTNMFDEEILVVTINDPVIDVDCNCAIYNYLLFKF